MARMKIEEVIDHLDSDVRKALAQTVREVLPDAEFNEVALFRAFKWNIGRQCRIWENVPDQYIEV